MTTSTKPLHEERIEEPAKAWRNWWQAPATGCVGVGPNGELTPLDPDEIAPGPVAHPSREIAEAKALALIDDDLASGGVVMKYLGAFPEGQRP